MAGPTESILVVIINLIPKLALNKLQCNQKFSDDSKSLLRANGYIFFRNSNCRTNLEVTHFYFWFNILNVIDSFFVVRDFATK